MRCNLIMRDILVDQNWMVKEVLVSENIIVACVPSIFLVQMLLVSYTGRVKADNRTRQTTTKIRVSEFELRGDVRTRDNHEEMRF